MPITVVDAFVEGLHDFLNGYMDAGGLLLPEVAVVVAQTLIGHLFAGGELGLGSKAG